MITESSILESLAKLFDAKSDECRTESERMEARRDFALLVHKHFPDIYIRVKELERKESKLSEAKDILQVCSETSAFVFSAEVKPRINKFLHSISDMESKSSKINSIIDEVVKELHRAIKKYPTWPTDPLHALDVLGEEYGEMNKGVLELVYEPNKTNLSEVRAEAIQTAAMCIRFLLSMNRYEWKPCDQHSQEL